MVTVFAYRYVPVGFDDSLNVHLEDKDTRLALERVAACALIYEKMNQK